MRDSDPAWQFFAALQNEADPKNIDRSLARGEALDTVLNEIVSDPSTDQNLLRKRYYSLCRNRLSKWNNRRALDRERFRPTHRRSGSGFGSLLLTAPPLTVFGQLAYVQLVNLIRSVLPDADVKLLLAIADGESYAEIARNHNMTVAGVKSKAFRIRHKLQKTGFVARSSRW